MKPMMLIFLLTFPTFAQLRPVHTFSIVARDPQTGEMGVAVQSHAFSVGPIVAWAEAGVGAIATQSLADPSYGKLGLDLMRAGKTAPDTLLGLLNARPVFRDLLFRRRQCVFTAFELLYLNGKDLRTLPTLLAPELGEASSANLATITTSIELLAAGRELHASSSIHKST